ncbi:MAG: class I lanthipeptide [Hyphomicrobiales bacterium]
MKKRNLQFKKETIAKLNDSDNSAIIGGTNPSFYTVYEEDCAETRTCYTGFTCFGICKPSMLPEDCHQIMTPKCPTQQNCNNTNSFCC